MKKKTRIRLVFILLSLLFLIPGTALPQQEEEALDPGTAQPTEKYTQEELAQMLAPIALYPDALLTQILMASTYPIEIIEADRWIQKNPELKGDALDDALLTKDWDPSVKAVCHFPSILTLMSERISETANLGNAFLAQDEEVMNMIQELRAKAYARGNLATTKEQKVTVEKETIIIEPADPQIIYVPYYDPFYIYGPWWYPAYPPYYWGPARVSVGIGISYWPGFYFGFAFGSWSYFDWHNHYVYIDTYKRPRYVRYDRWNPAPGRWQHKPVHRRGVAYRDKSTARKYGQYPNRTRQFRPNTRGFPESYQQSPARAQRYDSRTTPDRIRGGDGQARIDRYTPEQQRIEPDRQKRPVQTTTQSRQRIEQENRKLQPAVPESQTRQRVERGRQQGLTQPQIQVQQPLSRQNQVQERSRVERQVQQQRVIENQVQRQRVQQNQVRQRIERTQPQTSRDNVFNRVDEGRMERRSSERGQYSRQQQRNDAGTRSGSGSYDRGSRGNQGRSR